MNKIVKLLLINLVYALIPICGKLASGYRFMSSGYLVCVGAAVLLLGVYAVVWQQVLKSTDLGFAYMFKGTSIIFVLILSWMVFDESISLFNVIGAAVIIGGIAIYPK